MLEPLSETDVGRKFGGTLSVVPACILDDAVTVTVLGAGKPVIDVDADGWGGVDVSVGPGVGELELGDVVRGEVDGAVVVDVEPGGEVCRVWVVCGRGGWNGLTYPLHTAHPIYLLLYSSPPADMYPAHRLRWTRRNSLYRTSILRRYWWDLDQFRWKA